ncbi:uncharacterized protein LOC119095871 [Pollicipes pollicipes]|uniref:uncharacterized protein LOC119095871 n=1 Tax=Pollicipes pollicipes TaxID=41117 RepID=UPI00188577A4|nr:uncharacterized protein LOC119095871 [Pollicipes pollicipes]
MTDIAALLSCSRADSPDRNSCQVGTMSDGRPPPLALQDGTYADGPRRRDVSSRSVQVTEPAGSGPDAERPQVAHSQDQQQRATPGVYYPPDDADCETKFKTKESHKNGNTKTGFKAKGKYKAHGGSKQKEDKGGKTIPICLPLCGGAACSIM